MSTKLSQYLNYDQKPADEVAKDLSPSKQQRLRAKIAKDIEAFLAKGGEIQYLPSGVSTGRFKKFGSRFQIKRGPIDGFTPNGS